MYKVNYDEENWELIINTLASSSFNTIPAINRVLLIENSMDLANTGYISYDIPFDLLSYLKHEDEYLPWKTALAKLNYISNVLERSSVYGAFKVSIIFKCKTWENLGLYNSLITSSLYLINCFY